MNDNVGQRIGRFRIEGLITRGNTGTVYKAVDTSSQEPVALRVFPAQAMGYPSTKQKVLAHAQLLSTLRHPNIARIEGYGEAEGLVYVATELAPDGPLVSSALTAPGRPMQSHSLWHRLDLVRQVADGLHCAHQKNVVHGDLNPKTLLLKQTAPDLFLAKIVDFGFGGILEHSSAGATELTGNPAYMAPEQWQVSNTDPRTDVYALGVILYQMAVGTLPFPASARASAMYNHLYVAPQRPCQARPDLPSELEVVILRCLAKSPSDRFPSAADLSLAVQSVIAHKEKSAEPADFAEPLSVGALAIQPATLPPVTLPAQAAGPMLVPRPEVAVGTPFVAAGVRPHKEITGVPCFYVVDQRGAVLRRGYVQSSGATIGTAADNLVVLESPDISSHHARIDWDGHRVTLTDLGSRTSTFLDEHRLLPQVAQEWPTNQQARVGPYLLILEQANPDVENKDVLDVIVERAFKTMTLVPGKASECRVTVANHRTTVDHVSLSVEGIPSEWVQGTGYEIALNPYDKHEVLLSIHVPKASSSTAGEYSVTIRANSVANPDDPGEVKVKWTVAPFDSSSLGVVPAKIRSRKRAGFGVTVHNTGNRPATYTLSAVDDDHELSFAFRTEDQGQEVRPKIELKPGAKASVRLGTEATKTHWLGKSRPHVFRIHSTPVDQGDSQAHDATLIQAPLIPTWALLALPILLAVVLLVLPRFAKPKFRGVTVEPANAVAGEPVIVHWQAFRAKSLEIRPVAAGIRPDQGSYTISQGFQQTTVLTVVASNPFGTDQREVAVQVRPPAGVKAASMELTASSGHVKKGDNVTITWNVNAATRIQFSEIGDVGPRGEYSDTPQQDHTYTLTAYNVADIPTVKQVMVHVEEAPIVAPPKPHLTVDKTLIHQGQAVVFNWDAPGAESVRIDAPTPTTLIGDSGQRQAQLKGKGTYTFTIVSTAKGLESRSDPVMVNVTCTVIQQAMRTCHDSTLVQWR